MKSPDTHTPSQKLMLGLSVAEFVETPSFGVHVVGRSSATLCGLLYDQSTGTAKNGAFFTEEHAQPTEKTVVTCPECIEFMDKLKLVAVDREDYNIRYPENQN